MFGKIPLALVGMVVGSLLTLMGFIAYGMGNATLNLAGFFYGLPLLLGGFALKSSEINPIPFTTPTSDEVLALREEQATETQTKLRKDVTRYRYGQEVHLDEALVKVGLSPNDEVRPNLVGIQEKEIEGAYTLVLEFESPKLPLEKWHYQQERIEKFFGPDIRADITEAEEGKIDMALIRLLPVSSNKETV
ncbi:MAG: DUF2854 domain-containing protein [Microcystaceae cyanobacterium]